MDILENLENPELFPDPSNNCFANYMQKMEALGINTTNPHWFANQISDEIAIKIVTDFWTSFYSQAFVGMKLVQDAKRFGCMKKGCLNPQHYRLVFRNISIAKFTDIRELAEVIDLKLYDMLGLKTYLAEFNENNPLPATERDMRLAVEYAKTKLKNGWEI